MKERKWAILIAVFLVIILAGSLAGIFVMSYVRKNSEGACYARIYQDGTLIEEINLSEVEESYRKTIVSSNGGHNTIEVRPGSIGIVEADCPDKLCQKQGFSGKILTSIVCLPNRLVIELVNEESAKEEFDVVIQ